MVGLSVQPVCGVRDYTARVSEGLGPIGVEVGTYWCNRRPGLSPVLATREVLSWTKAVAGRLRADHPDVVVLQYSAFAFGYRGVPFFVVPILRRLGQLGAPIVVILHELAFPWRYLGARGWLWAVSQRLALPFLLSSSSAVVVTTDERRGWVLKRAWLPRRPISFLPVPSNVPLAAALGCSQNVVGVFGYGAEYVDIASVIRGAKLASREIAGLRLRLLGAPGQDSEAAKRWRRLADDADVSLEFTGVLDQDALSRAISQVRLIIFADMPTSRRGTLAASLLHGRAVIAFDGPQTWPALRDADAVCLVQPAPVPLAAAITWLMRDQVARECYENRAEVFYGSAMSQDVVARHLAELLVDTRQSHTRPGPRLPLSKVVRRPTRATSEGPSESRSTGARLADEAVR